MPHPIFLSVASNDVKHAELVFNRYASDIMYLYSKNGKNGTWMWDEIEKEELPQSKAFIIFWSKNYINNSGTIRELEFAKQLIDRGLLREFCILRCDDSPIFYADADIREFPERTAFDLLKTFLRHVRADSPKSQDHIYRMVDNIVSKVDRAATPLQPRPQLQEDLKEEARIDHFRYRPSVWVSGLNGYGRKTLIGEFMREVDPNAVPVFIDIDETTLPGQISARIKSKVFESALDQSEGFANDANEVCRLIEQTCATGRYVIFRQNRVYEEGAEVPEWIDDVLLNLSISRSPKLFIVSQLPVSDNVIAKCGDKLGAFRMRAMEDGAAEEFVWKLISSLRGSPEKWDIEKVEKIVQKSGGTPELMIAIVKIAMRLNDLSSLDEIIGHQAAQFSDTMASLVGWAFKQLDGYDDEKRALLFMNDVSPVTLHDIQQFLGAERPASEIVSKLSSLSLIERSDDDLFRLSPLLSRRLSTLLTTRDLVSWHKDAINRFAEAPLEIEDGEDGYLRVETKIKAELYSGKLEVSNDLKKYVSYAHYLQIGIRLYNARRFKESFRLLKVSFENRSLFSLNTSIEIARFYCLCAIRLRNENNSIAACIGFLRSRHQGQSMADFLEAERLRFDQRHDEAIKFFEKAQKTAKDNKERYREERIIRPYLDSLLRTRSPNLKRAKELADRSVSLNRTFFSLAMRVRVYLRLWGNAAPAERSDRKEEYERVLSELQRQPGAQSFYAQARAEEAEAFGDFDDAIEWMRQAIDASPRFDLRLRLWGIQLRSDDKAQRTQMIRVIEELCADNSSRAELHSFALPIAERYARALKLNDELKQFRISQLGLPLTGQEIRNTFLKAKDRFYESLEFL